MLGVTEIDGDGLCMACTHQTGHPSQHVNLIAALLLATLTDMKIPIWLGREPSEHLATRLSEMFLLQLRLDLRILSWSV